MSTVEAALGEARELVAWSRASLRQAIDGARARPLAAALVGLTVALAAFAYAPVLRWLVDVWSSNPYYAHGFLLLPIAPFVAWNRRERLAQAPRRVHDVDVLWLAPAAALFILGRGMSSNYLQAWSLAPLLVGLLLLTQGRDRTRLLTWPLAMMALLLPVPFQEWFFGPLQRAATAGAAGLVSAFGMSVSWSATTLTVAGHTFEVVPLCAGLSSTLSLFAITALATLLWPVRPAGARAAVFALVLPIALVSNALRIASTVTVAAWRGPELALAFFHSGGALLLYAVGMGAIAGTIWAARRWTDASEAEATAAADASSPGGRSDG